MVPTCHREHTSCDFELFGFAVRGNDLGLGVCVHLFYSSKNGRGYTIAAQDLHHLASVYGVKSLLEINEGDDGWQIAVFDPLNDPAEGKELLNVRS